MSQATYELIIAVARLRRRHFIAGQDPLGDRPLEHFIIEAAREGWTPPEPSVNYDLLAAREFVAAECESRKNPEGAKEARTGVYDRGVAVGAALAAVRAGKVGIS
jgi:hypothetical protein